MRSSRLVPTNIFSLFLTLLLTLFTTNVLAYAADEDEGESYDEQARVVRISLIKGEVTLKRRGNNDWEQARLNFPIVEGDTIATDRESQLEVQIDARNFVRVGSNAMLRFVTLRDEGVALSVIEGTTSIRLAKFDRDHEYFEVDAPKSTLSAEQKGVYRIDVAREGRVRFTVTDGGRARIYSETSGFALRDGRTAELINEGSAAGDWELFAAAAPDSWDAWVSDRERYLAQRFRYNTDRYDSYVWGGEDLDAYGDWSYVNDYGWIWRPHVTVINNYVNWAPYRYGRWVWVWPYGWTWVGYEPWGWAPYHYGRWVYHNNYWAWCPRSYYHRNRSWWRPALVAFHISIGNRISWYPLSYHHRDPRSRHYNSSRDRHDRDDRRDRRDRRDIRDRDVVRDLRRNDLIRGVTSTTAGDFGGDGVRFQGVNQTLARRVVDDEPLGDVPVRPANVYLQKGTDRTEGTRIAVTTPRVKPAAEVIERPTGAAMRKVGMPLDGELRRSRVFGGRESKVASPDVRGSDDSVESRPTGAVTRPPKTVNVQPTDGGTIERDKVIPRVPRTDATEDPSVIKRERDLKTRPERVDPGTVNESTKPSKIDNEGERPAKTVRPQPRERDETPTYEPPARKYEPPPRSEPAPRNEPPQRSEPVRKYEPPPQRSEPVRKYEPPPQRSEPSPQRSEPPPQRSEPPPQRSEPAPKSDPPPQKSEPAKVERPRPSAKEAP